MTYLEKLITRARMEAIWQGAVRLQRLQERIANPLDVECPCGNCIKENLYLANRSSMAPDRSSN